MMISYGVAKVDGDDTGHVSPEAFTEKTSNRYCVSGCRDPILIEFVLPVAVHVVTPETTAVVRTA
jgi:hypothetical protein